VCQEKERCASLLGGKKKEKRRHSVNAGAIIRNLPQAYAVVIKMVLFSGWESDYRQRAREEFIDLIPSIWLIPWEYDKGFL